MKTRHFLGTRPPVPEDWIICNAPRPLQGTRLWTGDFITGVLYAGIDPKDEFAAGHIEFNTRQDAKIIQYYTKDELVQVALEHLKEYEIDPVELREWLVNRALDILNG
jgi:hypothetical protein